MFPLLLLLYYFVNSNAELFTAMSDMNHLLRTESEMIRTVENYISAQEQRLTKLKSDLLEMERVHDLATKSPEEFLGNPINSYLLIKRLTSDWGDFQGILSEDSVGQAMLQNLTNMTEILKWPDNEDLNGVAVALMRLQDTYKLDTAQLAQGNILGVKSAYREMTVSDCFELGRQSYNVGDHYHTLLWMNEALTRHEKEVNPSIDKADILEYLAFSTYKQGNIRQALKLTDDLLDERPNHNRAQGNRVYYLEALQQENLAQRGESAELFPENEAVRKGYTIQETTKPLDTYQIERESYERLCRGEGRLSTDVKKKLNCFYQRGPSKYLLLAPVKAELVYIDPTVTIYHDVMYESEMNNIRELATPRFKRATVQNYKTGALETASYRISKSAWLKTEESPQIASVNRRIEAITGLNLDTAEELQIANYGVGGHYEPHFDYARREEKDAFKGLGTGNRIATFLFYMTDVEAGGATVFPHVELSLWPKKGAAAFWYNLHPSGEGDELTRHAACPVLVGQKWVSNKWIHERGQEFRKPCTLNYNDH